MAMKSRINILSLVWFCGCLIVFQFTQNLYPNLFNVNGLLLGTDMVGFYDRILHWEASPRGILGSLRPNGDLHVGIYGALCSVSWVGCDLTLIQICNLFVHWLSMFLIADAASNLVRGASRDVLLVCLLVLPTPYFWVLQVHRDTFFIFGFVLTIWCFIKGSDSGLTVLRVMLLGLIYAFGSSLMVLSKPYLANLIIILLVAGLIRDFLNLGLNRDGGRSRVKITGIAISLCVLTITIFLSNLPLDSRAKQIQAAAVITNVFTEQQDKNTSEAQSPNTNNASVKSPFVQMYNTLIDTRMDLIHEVENSTRANSLYLGEYTQKLKDFDLLSIFSITINSFIPFNHLLTKSNQPRLFIIPVFFEYTALWFLVGAVVCGLVVNRKIEYRNGESLIIVCLVLTTFIVITAIAVPNFGHLHRTRWIAEAWIIALLISICVQIRKDMPGGTPK
jgi:hypothetical protein